MALKRWVGGVAAWEAAAAWSPAGPPTAGDDAVIGDGAGAASVLLSRSATVGSIALAGAGTLLEVDGPSFSAVNGITLGTGTTLRFASSSRLVDTRLTLAGGTLQGAILDGVTLRGTLDAAAYGPVRVSNLVTLAPDAGQPGLLLLGPGASLLARDAAVLDGGIILAGSADPGQATRVDASARSLTLGPGGTLDAVGAVIIVQGSRNNAAFINDGVVNVGPGGTLSAPGGLGGAGSIRVLGGTLTTSVLAVAAAFDDGAGTLRLTGLTGAGGTPTPLTGFRAGDALDLAGLAWGGDVTAAVSGGVLQVSKAGVVQAAFRLTDSQPGGEVQVARDGDLGTLVTTTAQPAAPLAFTDQTLGASGVHAMDPAGPGAPDYLQWQHIGAGGDTATLSTGVPNVFIHTGGGSKSITVGSGRNVLDGGTGSAFLTGGSGADTYFVDVRGGGTVWDTLADFGAGDAVTVWGYQAGAGTMRWDGVDGAAGHQGATLRLDLAGDGLADASVTFAGFSLDQARGLQTLTGVAGGLPYLYLSNPVI